MSEELLVLVDGGHGLGTSGKQTPDGEKEWTFNNKVVLGIVNGLKKYKGYRIVRLDDPTGKTDPLLINRTNRANALIREHLADGGTRAILVSSHHNAAGSTGKYTTATGVETFYIDQTRLNYQVNLGGRNVETSRINASKKLAEAVHPGVVKAMGLRDRGIKRGNLHMVREPNCPSILVEGGFMDGSVDIKALRDAKKLDAQGKAIADGIAKYAGLKAATGTPVAPSAKPTAPAEVKGIGRVKILADKLNLRDKPDLSGKVIRELHAGNEYNVYEIDGMWYKLSSVGWASIGSAKNYMQYTPHPKKKVPKPAPKPVAPKPASPKPAKPAAKPVEQKPLHRVSADGKQVNAFRDEANALNQARESLKSGAKDVRITKQ